jgi:lysophospholipase L1-like esterase
VSQAIGPDNAAIVPGTTHAVTFDGGKHGITLAPGTKYAYSDPVAFAVHDGEDLAVDLQLPAAEPGSETATHNTSFITADNAGDHVGQTGADGFSPGASSADPVGPPAPSSCAGCSTYALTGVDVLTDEAVGAVVGLGSSTFHGDGSDTNAWNSVLNDLAVRIAHELQPGHRVGIVGAGVSGDTLHAGLTRTERDAFSVSGVTAIIAYDINDVAVFNGRTAEQVEADYRTLIAESHDRGIRVYCPTWAPDASIASPTDERGKVNAWLLTSQACDGVVDWDAVLRDPLAPQTFRPDYFADGIHPNPAGAKAMSDAVPLSWFTRPPLGGKAPTVCVSRRVVVLHLRAPRGEVLRSARVFPGGREVTARQGHRITVRISLRGLTRNTARVTTALKLRSGRTVVRTRVYRLCVPRG